jgi:hypothetical protein
MASYLMLKHCYRTSPLATPTICLWIWSCRLQRRTSRWGTSWRPLHLPPPRTRHWLPLVGLYVTIITVLEFQVGRDVESTFQAIVVPGALYSVTYLLQPGTSKLKVPLIDNFATGSSSVMAKVDLGRRDGWKGLGRGEGKEVSVHSATLRGTLRHRGIRFVLTHSQSWGHVLTV